MQDYVTPVVSLLIAVAASTPGFLFYIRHMRRSTTTSDRIAALTTYNEMLQAEIVELRIKVRQLEQSLSDFKAQYDDLDSNYRALKRSMAQ